MIFDLQKASLSKRISAFLFDFIILCVIAVGIATLLSLIVGYDARLEQLEIKYNKYEEIYGIDTDISTDDYNALTEAEKQKYADASNAMAEDEEMTKLYSILMNLTLITVSFAILLAYVITEVLVPLFFKNGQTLGKKIFGVALMRTDGVAVSPFQIFVRAILGKYTIETMIPVFLLLLIFFGAIGDIGFLIVALLLLLQLIVMIATRSNSLIHDLFAVTVAVDMSSQMIFKNADEMLEYKKALAEKKAREQAY